MMKLELYQRVVVTHDFVDEKIRKGDIAWLIDYVPHPEGQEEGVVLEIFNIFGESLHVAVVPGSAIAPLRPDHVPGVRSVAEIS